MNRCITKKGTALTLMLAAALIISLGATQALAQGRGMGKGMGCGPMMANLTPEQASQLFDLKEKFRAETAGLRKQMAMKRVEMAALWKAETPDQNQIKAKQKEMNALKEQLQDKMVAFRLEARKICPMGGMGMGMMGGGMGMGMCGMGPGGMGMDPGPGAM